jgi:hypothetical protein
MNPDFFVTSCSKGSGKSIRMDDFRDPRKKGNFLLTQKAQKI